MQYSFASPTYKTRTHGIDSSVVNSTEPDGRVVVNLVYTFFVKRKGILKRWNAIYENFPNLGDMKTDVEFYRCIKRNKDRQLDPTNIRGYVEKGDTNWKTNGGAYIAHPFLKHKKTAINIVHETIKVTITKPLIFVSSIRDELERVMKVRDFITAENTRLAAVDKINKIMNKPTMPEYQEADLERLQRLEMNKGYSNGDGFKGDGSPDYLIGI